MTLTLTLTIQNYSDEELAISQNLNYGSYVDLDRSPVVGKDDRVVTIESDQNGDLDASVVIRMYMYGGRIKVKMNQGSYFRLTKNDIYTLDGKLDKSGTSATLTIRRTSVGAQPNPDPHCLVPYGALLRPLEIHVHVHVHTEQKEK